jgi:hypothetical protein
VTLPRQYGIMDGRAVEQLTASCALHRMDKPGINEAARSRRRSTAKHTESTTETN